MKQKLKELKGEMNISTKIVEGFKPPPPPVIGRTIGQMINLNNTIGQ